MCVQGHVVGCVVVCTKEYKACSGVYESMWGCTKACDVYQGIGIRCVVVYTKAYGMYQGI